MEPTPETVALAGNPNAGKTTLFNALCGRNEKVGNYGGVTVEVKKGGFFTPHGRRLELIDLPGTFSLEGGSPDQRLAGEVLSGKHERHPAPDLVVCVVDASNLERHLQLTLEILELGLPAIVALNMVDVAEKSGLRLDPVKLSEELGVPVVPIQANRGKGITELRQAMRHPFPSTPEVVQWEKGNAEARRAFGLRTANLSARRATLHSTNLSDRLDAVLLHPVFGWVCFAAIMFALFWSIFSFAGIPMGWIESLQESLTGAVAKRMPEGDLRDLITQGIIGGVGAVVIFLPQILLLFLFIGLLESSGYMARAAFLMDGVMGRAGLSGKAFLPLLSSCHPRSDGDADDRFGKGAACHHFRRALDELFGATPRLSAPRSHAPRRQRGRHDPGPRLSCDLRARHRHRFCCGPDSARAPRPRRGEEPLPP
jgi:ferrous iron transport protein B